MYESVNASGISTRTINPNPPLSEGPSDKATVTAALEAEVGAQLRGDYPTPTSDAVAAAVQRIDRSPFGREWLGIAVRRCF